MNTYNPWRGLSAYKDPQEAKHYYEFCGRDAEKIQLSSLIENNLFVTLYGRTGVGKTSLLKAGVMPLLREKDFYPIYIRLSQEPGGITYAQAIVNKLEGEVNLKKERTVDFSNEAGNSKTYLWKYFCTTKFKTGTPERYVYPVIILDQFEEIFYTHKRKAELLLQQIYVLLNDDLIVPAEEGFSDETNYRFVASIREDNLFYLEDSIDELSLNLYKDNRYRLKPMNDENARKAILVPGSEVIDRTEASEIAEKIINLSRDLDGTISSLILSLICSLMYEQAAKQKSDKPLITLRQIPATQSDTDAILQNFYLENTSKQQRKIIEEKLLTDDGHRKAEKVDIPNKESLLSVGNRILQRLETNEGEKVEIVHDRLAKVIYMQRRRRDANRFRILLRIFILVLLILIGGFALYQAGTTTNGSINAISMNYDELPITQIVLTGDSAKITMYENDNIKKIFIGDSVEVIECSYWKDNLEIEVSPLNKYFKWDSIYEKNSGAVGFLYRRDNPQEAIYMQSKPFWSIRLPAGWDTLKYNGETYTSANGCPRYGEKYVQLDKYDDDILDFFKNDDKIERVELKGIKYIGDDSFRGCVNLKQINLDSVESIGDNAFAGCISLTEVTLPEEECEIDYYAFYGCTNLKKVRLPRILKGNMSEAFSFCYDLRSIVLPDSIVNTSGVSGISSGISGISSGIFALLGKPSSMSSISGIATMFRCCPNIEDIEFHSENTHFRYVGEDSVLYYDSIPVIYKKGIQDSLKLPNNISLKQYRGIIASSKGFSYPDSMMNFTNAIRNEWNSFDGNYYYSSPSSVTITTTITTNFNGVLQRVDRYYTLIILNNKGSILNLPPRGVNYCLIGKEFNIKEIHVPTPDYNRFSVEYLHDANALKKNEITLYVPWGTKDDYLRSGKFFDYKEIKEDPLWRRVSDVVIYYWGGITSTFGRLGWIFYPLIFVGLCILAIFFYWLRIKQMKHRGKMNKKKAIFDAVLAVPVAFIGFVPVYYLVYIILTNHVMFDDFNKANYFGMLLGSIAGVASSVVCSYFFIFSGKGKILRRFKRMTKNGL